MNSHILSIIEQKLCPDDRKVWSRDLEHQGGKATLAADELDEHRDEITYACYCPVEI